MAIKSPSVRPPPSYGLDPNRHLSPAPQQITSSWRMPQVRCSALLMAVNSPSGVEDASTPQQEGVPSVRSAQTWYLPALMAVKGPLSGGDVWPKGPPTPVAAL